MYFGSLRSLLKAIFNKHSSPECVQVFRAMGTFASNEGTQSMEDALPVGANIFDAVRHLLRAPSNQDRSLDTENYPDLPFA